MPVRQGEDFDCALVDVESLEAEHSAFVALPLKTLVPGHVAVAVAVNVNVHVDVNVDVNVNVNV